MTSTAATGTSATRVIELRWRGTLDHSAGELKAAHEFARRLGHYTYEWQDTDAQGAPVTVTWFAGWRSDKALGLFLTYDAPPVVEIPADVKDNSEAVTEYAFMSHRAPDKGKRTPVDRDNTIIDHGLFGYVWHEWRDVNPDGQRCRFDMFVREDGTVTHLLHTEYFTRTACAECEYSYAGVYQVIQTEDGMSDAVPRCDQHADRFRRALTGEAVTLHESEPLLIGQHD